MLLTAPLVALMPLSHDISESSGVGSSAVWVFLMVLIVLYSALQALAYSCIMLYVLIPRVACTMLTMWHRAVSNSVPPSRMGRMNGVGQMFASFFRAVGPMLAGVLWSATGERSFTFHYGVSFQLMILVAFACAWVSFRLPEHVEFPKSDEPDDGPAPADIPLSEAPKSGEAAGPSGGYSSSGCSSDEDTLEGRPSDHRVGVEQV
jgi:MFS family permease